MRGEENYWPTSCATAVLRARSVRDGVHFVRCFGKHSPRAVLTWHYFIPPPCTQAQRHIPKLRVCISMSIYIFTAYLMALSLAKARVQNDRMMREPIGRKVKGSRHGVI
jgi:hypothetical protein